MEAERDSVITRFNHVHCCNEYVRGVRWTIHLDLASVFTFEESLEQIRSMGDPSRASSIERSAAMAQLKKSLRLQ